MFGMVQSGCHPGGNVMANGIRSIYSRRQRMAPGQYDTPLADFLDNLPGYFNQYQQNQLALERQKLADKRYEDAQEIAKEQREEEQRRYNTGLINAKRKENIGIMRSLISSGKTNQALMMAKALGETDFVTTLQGFAKKEGELEDRFNALRDRVNMPDEDIFALKDDYEDLMKNYDGEPFSNYGKALDELGGTIYKEVDRRNKGVVPVSEWEELYPGQGRLDRRALENAEESLQDLIKARDDAVATGDKLEAVPGINKSIKEQMKEIANLLSDDKYKLETEAQYRARKESEKQVSSVLQKANMARAQGLSFPNIGPGETTFDIVTPTQENVAQVNDDINKALDGLVPDPEDAPPYDIPQYNEEEQRKKEMITFGKPLPDGGGDAQKQPVDLSNLINLGKAQAEQEQSPPVPADTTLKLGKEISANIKKPKGIYGNPESALASTYKKMKKIKYLEDKSNYNLDTKGGQQSYKNAYESASKLREQLKKDILSIYDPDAKQFRYPGYAEMFSPVGDTDWWFGKKRQLDTRNIQGGWSGRQFIPVADIMPFIDELFPPQFAGR